MALSKSSEIAGAIKLLRPQQWIKNGFVLGPLVFAGLFTDVNAIVQALSAVIIFCAGSSCIYILNDLRDIEEDRVHPKKSQSRPLAAGTVSTTTAYILLTIFVVLTIAGLSMMPELIWVIVSYAVINLAYSYYLKRLPVIDIFCIAAGFVLRVYAGAVAIHVDASPWMVVTTLSLALYLAAIKRRQELLQSGHEARQVLSTYSVALLDKYAEMAAISALLFYGLYVFTVRPELVYSLPFVLFGLYRYWYVVEILASGESPTDTLMRDWPLLATVVGWITACVWVLSAVD